ARTATADAPVPGGWTRTVRECCPDAPPTGGRDPCADAPPDAPGQGARATDRDWPAVARAARYPGPWPPEHPAGADATRPTAPVPAPTALLPRSALHQDAGGAGPTARPGPDRLKGGLSTRPGGALHPAPGNVAVREFLPVDAVQPASAAGFPQDRPVPLHAHHAQPGAAPAPAPGPAHRSRPRWR